VQNLVQAGVVRRHLQLVRGVGYLRAVRSRRCRSWSRRRSCCG
jgi:hypothetical protein